VREIYTLAYVQLFLKCKSNLLNSILRFLYVASYWIDKYNRYAAYVARKID